VIQPFYSQKKLCIHAKTSTGISLAILVAIAKPIRNNQNIHKEVNGETKSDTFTQWNSIQQ
jgi:hypothetical protein